MIESGTTVFVVSNEPWGDVWFSKHHYANELAKMGFNVYFVDPVEPWSVKNLFSFKTKTKFINDNLTIISYKNNFPVRVFSALFRSLNDYLNFKKIFRNTPKDQPILFWQFDVFRFAQKSSRKRLQRVYHVADPYMNKETDLKIARSSDIILCTSTQYASHYKNNFSDKPILYIPHGISDDEKNVSTSEILAIKEKYGDFALLSGTIAHNVDINLILSTATVRKDKKIIIIGPKKTLPDHLELLWIELTNLPNVEYIGVVNGKTLKNWVAASTFCFIPYSFDLVKINYNGNSSLKFINYLAQYKPIVTTINGEIAELINECVYWAKNEEQYLEFIEDAWNDNLKVNEQVIEGVLTERKYSVLIKSILNELKSNEN